MDSTPLLTQNSDEFDSIKTSFPLSKIAGICKMDPDLETINKDAVKIIAKATEYFIEELSIACYTQAILDKRKTVQPKDVDKVIATNPLFEFLEDALDNWYEDVLHSPNEADDEPDAVDGGEPDAADGDTVEETDTVATSIDAQTSEEQTTVIENESQIGDGDADDDEVMNLTLEDDEEEMEN